MDANKFLTQLGWPADRLGEAGRARWSGSTADGLSDLQAIIVRDGSTIHAIVADVGIDQSSELLSFEARVSRGAATVEKSQAGSPPDPIPAEDAIHLFNHMRSGLGRFVFSSSGPLVLPQAKPA